MRFFRIPHPLFLAASKGSNYPTPADAPARELHPVSAKSRFDGLKQNENIAISSLLDQPPSITSSPTSGRSHVAGVFSFWRIRIANSYSQSQKIICVNAFSAFSHIDRRCVFAYSIGCGANFCASQIPQTG